MLVLPSEIQIDANMISLRAIDGDTSYHSGESFSLGEHPFLFNFIPVMVVSQPKGPTGWVDVAKQEVTFTQLVLRRFSNFENRVL